VDDVLGDGIHDQNLLDNDCYKEIQSHMDLRNVPRNDYKTMTAEEAIKALIRDSAPLPDPIKKRLQDYQVHFTYLYTRKIFFRYHMISSVCIIIASIYIYRIDSFSFFKLSNSNCLNCLRL